MPAWILWLFLAALLTLPILAAFVEDRPPRNEIMHEQAPEDPGGPDEAEMASAALGCGS